jgi:ABC-type amino acid transport substrate-binding protein
MTILAKSSGAWKKIDVNYVPVPPGIAMDKQGKMSGFDIDILHLIAQYLGPQVKVREKLMFSFDLSLEEVYGQNGTSNFAIGPFSFFAEEFAKGIDFSKLLVTYTAFFMYRKPGNGDLLNPITL